MEKTLYGLVKKVSGIITPETDSFYEWALNTARDYGGFLRTQWCRMKEPVRDRRIKPHTKCLVCTDIEFDESRYYSGISSDGTVRETDMGMQLFYDSEESIDDNIDFSVENQYPHIYVFDLDGNGHRYRHITWEEYSDRIQAVFAHDNSANTYGSDIPRRLI